MKYHGIEQYVNAIFAYCLKRLSNVEDAQDLAQEILCEAIASMRYQPVENFESWLWTIAHNRFCRFITRQKRMPVPLSDSLLAELPDEVPEDDMQEAQQAAFAALHTLAASHREIMIDFYVNGLSCDEIAQKHGLPPKTVRTRLFYGREKLRKRWQMKMEQNHIYHQQQWLMTRNGDVDPAILDRQIVRAIIAACYEQYRSVDEISLATGIPTLYVEDELPRMLQSELLQRKGPKYRANLIIHRARFADEAEALLWRHSEALSARVIETLRDLMPHIRAIGFHGCGFPEKRLWWSMVPAFLRKVCHQARDQLPELGYAYRPLRRDGARGWLCAYETTAAAQELHYDYLRQKGFRCYWSHELYSTLTLHSLLARLKSMEIQGPEFSLTDELLIADCIRCDLVVRTPAGLQWNIPVFNAAQAEALTALLSRAAAPLANELAPVASALYEKMKLEIPPHLHEQISGVYLSELCSIIQMVCEHLLQKGYLEHPSSELFAGRVIMYCGEKTTFMA